VIGETTALGLSVLMTIAHLFTGVSLPANHGLRPIESIIAGDLVWAMDPDTGEEDWREVLETFVHPDAVLELAIEDGSSTEVLTVTGGHPFWERERGWTPAGELLPGDEVFTSRGGWARIGGGTWIAGEQLVYNFEVEGAHTYFVGEAGAWVHNACARTAGADVAGLPRSGSALKTDPYHGFPRIIDNFARDATRFEIPTRGPGGVILRNSELFQVEGGLEGALHGRDGVFEWIVDQGELTHRRFIPGGGLTGYPNQIP